MRRIYLNYPLPLGESLQLDATSHHYLVRVLRCRDGDTIVAFNGDGNDYVSTIKILDRKKAYITVTDKEPNDSESPLKTILIQGLSKGERMDIAIQKAVELGVNEIYPVKTDYCAIKIDKERESKKYAHWQGVISAACEQSGRSLLPVIHPIRELRQLYTEITADMKWLLHPYECKLNETSGDDIAVKSVALLIGPEGGLSDEETQDAISYGFIAKQIGQRILRTETAAIAALSIAQQRWGDIDV